jgi:hypothetical protein
LSLPQKRRKRNNNSNSSRCYWNIIVTVYRTGAGLKRERFERKGVRIESDIV